MIANKITVLQFIHRREVVDIYDLVEEFDYLYSGAQTEARPTPAAKCSSPMAPIVTWRSPGTTSTDAKSAMPSAAIKTPSGRLRLQALSMACKHMGHDGSG